MVGGGGGRRRGSLYTYGCTVTTRMAPALRGAAMSAILMFPTNCEGQSHKTVSTDLTRQCPQTTTFEEKGEPKRIRTEVPLLTSKPAHFIVRGRVSKRSGGGGEG